MSLGTEVDLSPGHIVLDGDPAPPRKGAQQLATFRSLSIVAERSPISGTTELLYIHSTQYAVRNQIEKINRFRRGETDGNYSSTPYNTIAHARKPLENKRDALCVALLC